MNFTRKMQEFNQIFSREERIVIILSSLVTIMMVALLWILAIAAFNALMEFTAPIFAKALNDLTNALLPGWHW